MSTYAQIADLMKYTSIRLSTPDDSIQQLLDNAERDIDILFNPVNLTDALFGFFMSGTVTGGSWAANIEWLGNLWMSTDIPWDADGPTVLAALNAMTDMLGQPMQGQSSWVQSVDPSAAPDWAFGPLPSVPVVVQATAYMGGQVLLPFTVVNNLEGDNPQISVRQLRGGGTRWDVWAIEPFQVYALNRACCAQAEYRDQMGEDFYIRAQYASVTGPEFTTTGHLPRIGPKVKRELNGSGLIQYGARAAVGHRMGAAYAYNRLGGTPIPDDWRAV
jgi:hypothetical protein